jgi:hypothetical protein
LDRGGETYRLRLAKSASTISSMRSLNFGFGSLLTALGLRRIAHQQLHLPGR